jgi:hypothetical protein
MSLKVLGVIEIPGAAGSEFDHGIFDPGSGRVFIAHTRQSTIEVIDPAAACHIATLPDFPGAAGAVADDGEILVTNRGSASLAWLDGRTLKTQAVMTTGPRPNGAAIVKSLSLGIAACIGDESEKPTLQAFRLDTKSRLTLNLPGRPRWCVTDAAAERLFLCIREPSMILVAGLPDLKLLAEWNSHRAARMVSISTTHPTASTPPATMGTSSRSTAAQATSAIAGRSPVHRT